MFILSTKNMAFPSILNLVFLLPNAPMQEEQGQKQQCTWALEKNITLFMLNVEPQLQKCEIKSFSYIYGWI